jgi:DNA-binding transcriptional LysR family regulator
MELRQLAYFEAVASCGSFSRAAQQLHIAQPAVSAQIRRLETELGTPLLERTTRRVALTHAGELFLARTRTVLDQLNGAQDDLAELTAVRRGHVRIGATLVLGAIDLPRSLARFRRRHPGVTLALRAGLIAGLLADLDAGAVDIVLGPLHPDLVAGYPTRPLAEETVVLVTPPAPRPPAPRPPAPRPPAPRPPAPRPPAPRPPAPRPPAPRPPAPRHPGSHPPGPAEANLADFRDEPFVCLPSGSGLHAILLAAAAEAGFTPRIQLETHSPASIRELVAAGLGVALMAQSSALAIGPAVTVRPLRPAPPHPPIGTILPRDRAPNPATRAWQRYLEQAYGPGIS